MRILDKLIDYRPALRMGVKAVARVTEKRFITDVGFGDCPMFITYEFADETGTVFRGQHEGTESSFFNVAVGNEIIIMYLKEKPLINSPIDALGIIKAIGLASGEQSSGDDAEPRVPQK